MNGSLLARADWVPSCRPSAARLRCSDILAASTGMIFLEWDACKARGQGLPSLRHRAVCQFQVSSAFHPPPEEGQKSTPAGRTFTPPRFGAGVSFQVVAVPARQMIELWLEGGYQKGKNETLEAPWMALERVILMNR